MVILIALASRGIIDPLHALVVLHGIAIGTGASVLLLGRGMGGEALRISYFQALVNAFAGLAIGAWLLIADAPGLPNLIDLLERLHLGFESTLATGLLGQM